jgi:hypothetical protein
MATVFPARICHFFSNINEEGVSGTIQIGAGIAVERNPAQRFAV